MGAQTHTQVINISVRAGVGDRDVDGWGYERSLIGWLPRESFISRLYRIRRWLEFISQFYMICSYPPPPPPIVNIFVAFFRFFCLFDWWLSYFDFRPGELNRLSADGSILLKNGGGGAGGYGTAGFLHHQTSPAFQNHHQQPQQSQQQPQSHNLAAVGQHPSQLHVQSSQQTAAALMMNGKSPSRDLGGGSTPVLKMTAAHNSAAASTTQVIKAVV